MQLEKKKEQEKKKRDNGSQEWKSDMHSNANMTIHHHPYNHTVSVDSQSHNSSKQHARNTS